MACDSTVRIVRPDNGQLRHNPANPKWPDRDRFVLSNGHAFNRPGHEIVNHRTNVFLGDGCLMEGIGHQACSLAGVWKLNKLIALYDDNSISIDGAVKSWFADNTAQRFAASGWNVIGPVEGHDVAAVGIAIAGANACADQPTLIICRTTIGKGSPGRAGTAKAAWAHFGQTGEAVAARKVSHASRVPELLGGSADLTGSNLTDFPGCGAVRAGQPGGRHINYGVREFGRAALMKLGLIHVFTHDSIGLGEDGPTHQPVEHAASLRLIPNLDVWCSCDTAETAIAWTQALLQADGPSALLLSRQNLPAQPRSPEQFSFDAQHLADLGAQHLAAQGAAHNDASHQARSSN